MREVADSGGPRDRLFAVAALAVLIGTTAESSTEDATGSQGIGQAIGRLGGHDSPVADDLGLTFLILTLLIALISTGQISAMRTEEADGHLENLLVRPVSRTSWFAGRLGLSPSSSSSSSWLACWPGSGPGRALPASTAGPV